LPQTPLGQHTALPIGERKRGREKEDKKKGSGKGMEGRKKRER